MRYLVAVALACALCTLFTSRVAASPRRLIAVRVVEISGDQAYLTPGSAAGLRAGSRVRIGDLERRVERTSSSYAVVSARRLRVGDRGVAQRSVGERTTAELPTPRALDAFADQWPVAVLPATTQHPTPVPLGGRLDARPRKVDATLTASGSTIVPLEGDRDPMGRAELRGRLVASPSDELPLTLSADVAVQRWFGAYATGVASGDPRPWLRVRELTFSLGVPDGYRAEVGRLRYAAVNLGPLDGGRFEAARIGPLRIAAFGGLLPDPIDNRVDRGAGRFGAEFSLRGDRPELHSSLAMVLSGSVYDGKFDERRMHVEGQVRPAEHRVSAYADVANFDDDNPWGRPVVDLTAAGADFDLRFGKGRIGGRFDMRRPERSYWLSNALPSTWLCASSAALVSGIPCVGGDDKRYVGQGWGGLDFDVAQVDVGGSWAGSSDKELGQHGLGYATVRVPRIEGRYDVAIGGSYEGGTLLKSSAAARADFGVGWLDDKVHLNLYYRPARKQYQASLEGFWEHGLGAALRVQPSAAFALDLFGDTRLGDVDLVLVMMALSYRLQH